MLSFWLVSLLIAFFAGLIISGIAVVWGLGVFLRKTQIGICWRDGCLRVIAAQDITED